MGMVGVRLVDEIKNIKWSRLIKLVELIKEELGLGQIWVWAKDEKLQKKLENFKFSGRLDQGWNPSASSGQVGYLYIVESNLGSNKANCCVSRMITHEINGPDEQVTIDWKNENEFETPKPPVFWGGDYRDYVRVVIPASHKVQVVKLQDKELRAATASDFAIPNSLRQGVSDDMYVVEERGGLQIIGFWAVVPAGEKVRVNLNYESGIMNNGKILVRRQPGIESFPYKLIVDGKIVVDESVNVDKIFRFDKMR